MPLAAGHGNFAHSHDMRVNFEMRPWLSCRASRLLGPDRIGRIAEDEKGKPAWCIGDGIR